MRFAIFSDVHGNLIALNAVLADIRAQGVDEVICLGDVVGYGPHPGECLDLVREVCSTVVLGNHEAAVLDWLQFGLGFNEYARRAIRYTELAISAEHIAYMQELPDFAWNEVHGLMFAHGSFTEDWDFQYLDTPDQAWMALQRVRPDNIRTFFVGHTHVPYVCREIHGDPPLDGEIEISPDDRHVINVGSVGQPRDEDPRACYALFDTSRYSVTLHRVEYDVQVAVQEFVDNGLPDELGKRLLHGH